MVFARGEVVALGSFDRPVLAPGATATWVYGGVVLEDTPELVAVCHLPGSTVLTPSGPQGGPRSRLLLAADAAGPPTTTAWWGDAVVKVHRWGEPWSVWRWLGRHGWSHDRYVNLEQPWVRTSTGFHTDDWTLDLVASSAGGGWSVRTKDADELAWLRQVGALDDDEVAQVEAAGARARAVALAGGWPFRADWDRWLPDPSWPAAQLSPDGAPAVASPSGIGHVRLTVTDVHRSKAFYSRLLGAGSLRTDWSHLWGDPAVRDDPDRVYGGCSFTVGRQVLGLRPVAPAGDRFDPDRVGLDHLALTVGSRAELEAAAARLEAAGVEHGEVTDLPAFGVTILSVQDPDGINLELSAPLQP